MKYVIAHNGILYSSIIEHDTGPYHDMNGTQYNNI